MSNVSVRISKVNYLIIHRCEKEHKCRSVLDEESDSENVLLWLCRIDDDGTVDEDAVDADEFVVTAVVVAVVVDDAVVAFIFNDELVVTGVRLLLLLFSILSKLKFNHKEKNFYFKIKDFLTL